MDVRAPNSHERPTTSSSSFRLLTLAGRGDREALDALLSRHLPALHRWARGKLPKWARGVSETADLVQDVMLRTLGNLPHFEPRGHGALRAYLQHAVRNRVKDELRRVACRPTTDLPAQELVDRDASPLDQAIRQEEATRYRAALQKLAKKERELVIGRLELGLDYEKLTILGGYRTQVAVRVALHRATVKLASHMRELRACDESKSD